MTITLGALTLSDHLYLDGLDQAPGVAIAEPMRTLGGESVIQIGPALSGGRTLSLLSENHIQHSEVTNLKALEGTEVSLVHPRGTFTVIVTLVELEPDELLSNPDSAPVLFYSGSIQMIEV